MRTSLLLLLALSSPTLVSRAGAFSPLPAPNVLTALAAANDTILQINERGWWELGDTIRIGIGARAETNTIVGFGSVHLASPLISSHPAGTVVAKVDRACACSGSSPCRHNNVGDNTCYPYHHDTTTCAPGTTDCSGGTSGVGGWYFQPVSWAPDCGRVVGGPGTAYYFTGYASPDQSLSVAEGFGSQATGSKWLVVGGAGGSAGNTVCPNPANDPGMWCVAMLGQYTAEALGAIKAAGFTGLLFDFEISLSDITVQDTLAVLANTKVAGLAAAVTTSHCAPTGPTGFVQAPGPVGFAIAWGTSADVTFFSPQMYTGGGTYTGCTNAGQTPEDTLGENDLAVRRRSHHERPGVHAFSPPSPPLLSQDERPHRALVALPLRPEHLPLGCQHLQLQRERRHRMELLRRSFQPYQLVRHHLAP